VRGALAARDGTVAEDCTSRRVKKFAKAESRVRMFFRGLRRNPRKTQRYILVEEKDKCRRTDQRGCLLKDLASTPDMLVVEDTSDYID